MPRVQAFSTLGCPDLGWDEVVALARRYAIPGIELRCLGGTLDIAAALSQKFADPAAFARCVEEAGVRVVALDTSCRLSGSTDDQWQEMDALVPWADAIGGVPLRVFDGKSDAPSAAVEEMASRLRWWSDLRDKRGWRADVMVETHDTLFTSDLISRLVELVPDVRILWDSHHTWRRGGEAPEATWKAISRSVVHVHVKDSVARPSGRHGHTYVLPGTGEFPADALFRAIGSEAPLPVLSLEWERRWHPYLPPLEDALEAARARW